MILMHIFSSSMLRAPVPPLLLVLRYTNFLSAGISDIHDGCTQIRTSPAQ